MSHLQKCIKYNNNLVFWIYFWRLFLITQKIKSDLLSRIAIRKHGDNSFILIKNGRITAYSPLDMSRSWYKRDTISTIVIIGNIEATSVASKPRQVRNWLQVLFTFRRTYKHEHDNSAITLSGTVFSVLPLPQISFLPSSRSFPFYLTITGNLLRLYNKAARLWLLIGVPPPPPPHSASKNVCGSWQEKNEISFSERKLLISISHWIEKHFLPDVNENPILYITFPLNIAMN